MGRHRCVRRPALAAALIALAACAPAPVDEVRDAQARRAGVAQAGPSAGHLAAGVPRHPSDDLLPIPAQAAFIVVDPLGRTLASQHDEIIDTPMLAGSIMKPIALVAARDSGVLAGGTRMACRRTLRVGGRNLDCVHPGLGHALDASEAIAHSCNTFVAAVASRLTHSTLSGTAVAIGLPAVPTTAPLTLASLGLDGARATPRRWLLSIRALVEREQRRSSSFALDGMREAARTGSASALQAHGVAAFAKTGTAPMPGGGTAGLVVVIAADLSFAAIVVAPGGAGRDAAEIAGRLLRRDGRGMSGPAVTVRVGVVRGPSYVTHAVALDDYVAGVVDAEAPADASPAFRRALAIVARTWVVHHAARHAADGFDVCDLTHCQVFSDSRATGRAAADATRGIILRGPDAAPIDAAYSASCGGRLATGPDPAGVDHGAPWRAEISHRRLLEALRVVGVGGRTIDRLDVVSRGADGRARTLVVRTDRDHEVDADDFRIAVGRALGWQHVKSTWFDVAQTSRGFAFTGRGHGHGRGLCVVGASALLARGETIERVLEAYYPGARPGTLDGATHIRVRVPASAGHRRADVDLRVRRLVATLAVRLGVGVPRAIDLDVHPTIEAFQRATGLGWWTAARTRDARIDLVPIDLLDRRGRLDDVLAHELVHVLTATRLDGRPRWVHEGLAIVMARESPGGSPAGGTACPADDEFKRATAETLPGIYARAAACVSRELSTRAWDDVATPR